MAISSFIPTSKYRDIGFVGVPLRDYIEVSDELEVEMMSWFGEGWVGNLGSGCRVAQFKWAIVPGFLVNVDTRLPVRL